MIATVSPASKDTEHSLNTLRHACMMHGQQDGAEGAPTETRFVVGGTVKTVQARRIFFRICYLITVKRVGWRSQLDGNRSSQPNAEEERRCDRRPEKQQREQSGLQGREGGQSGGRPDRGGASAHEASSRAEVDLEDGSDLQGDAEAGQEAAGLRG